MRRKLLRGNLPMIRRPTKSFGMVGYLSSVVQQIAKADDEEERREE